MSWSTSLVKLSTYEVETHQKRLGEIVARKAQAEKRLVALQAEGEDEATRARQDAAAGWYQIGYLDGLRLRKAAVQAEIDAVAIEEMGARDALNLAFEEQKKYEQVVENARRLEVKEAAKRETAALDEMGLRRAAR
ncbi:MAG: flagellar export protein FliJ [Phenylobacterium sp.]|nr:flagellar export protein FliJ [Phenylobacterium sp.]